MDASSERSRLQNSESLCHFLRRSTDQSWLGRADMADMHLPQELGCRITCAEQLCICVVAGRAMQYGAGEAASAGSAGAIS
jgi:hypothetical protein